MKSSLLVVGILATIALAVVWTRSPERIDSAIQEAGAVDPLPTVSPGGASPASMPVTSATPSGSLSENRDGVVSEDLKKIIHQVRSTLPQRAQFKPADDEAAHHAGPELIQAGQALGDLAEYLERRPEEFRAASVFYANCAADESLMPASRAVCYAALMKKKDEWAPGVADRISRVGPEIVDIAKSLSE